MDIANHFNVYAEHLLAGSRAGCRRTVPLALLQGIEAKDLYQQLLWPAMELISRLWREDRINLATEHLATRINRVVADQIQAVLADVEPNNRKALVVCAPNEPEELGGQMVCDMLEAEGWEVYFLGGGVPDDEVVMLIGLHRPDLLMVYGTQPEGAPAVRSLIEAIRQIDPHPEMNIMLTGGVFSRAEGLWQEVNADLCAPDMRDAVEIAGAAQPRDLAGEPSNPPKRRRRRRPTLEPVGTVI